jgi:hypothetical protein
MTNEPLGSPDGSEPSAAKTGVELIAAERARQVEVEGWTAEHDAEHDPEDLARAAACYALPTWWRDPIRAAEPQCPPQLWPWEARYWKPAKRPSKLDRVRDLVKAGALIAAAIDSIQRSEAAAFGRGEEA